MEGRSYRRRGWPLPLALRAARPIVWIAEAFRTGPLYPHPGSPGHLGISSPSAKDNHQHVKLAKTQVADDLHALDGVDIQDRPARSLSPCSSRYSVEVLRHPLGESGVQHALVDGRSWISDGESIDLSRHRAHAPGWSSRPVGPPNPFSRIYPARRRPGSPTHRWFAAPALIPGFIAGFASA